MKLAAVKKFLSIAETTKRREPAQLIVGGKYRVGKKISNGAFGQLRWVTHSSAMHSVVIISLGYQLQSLTDSRKNFEKNILISYQQKITSSGEKEQ